VNGLGLAFGSTTTCRIGKAAGPLMIRARNSEGVQLATSAERTQVTENLTAAPAGWPAREARGTTLAAYRASKAGSP